ncbi:MAG: branched-chain amino acid ABC transporter permease [bacterium]|nr:branched-chain amino acid ABC transporter permease [bacterium]
MNSTLQVFHHKFRLPIILAGGILLLLLPAVLNPYHLRMAIMVGIYMVLASSLNIIIGFTGMFSLGHGAFYGIGAYTSALLARNFGWSFWITMLLAGLVAGCFGAMIGLATLRLRAIFLAFTTLGFGEITRIIILNWSSVTRGPMGVPGIPIPTLFGMSFKRITYYYLIVVLVLLTLLIVYRLYNSRVGRAFLAIREDELASGNMGINVFAFKTLAFMIACAIAGVAGAYYAHFARYISADQFGSNESFIILTMVALGGTGSILGPLVGACILVLLPEMFRFLAEYRMVLYGLILIGVIVLKPGGILGVKGLFERPEPLFKKKKKHSTEASL